MFGNSNFETAGDVADVMLTLTGIASYVPNDKTEGKDSCFREHRVNSQRIQPKNQKKEKELY